MIVKVKSNGGIFHIKPTYREVDLKVVQFGKGTFDII